MSAPGRETSSATGLEPFRRRLDQLDGEIAGRLGERFAICREIALYKREHDIPMMQPDRVAEVRSRYLARGAEVELPADFSADLFELLIAATCRMEDELIAAQAPSARDGDRAREAPDEATEAERERTRL
jgi:chorismate mutase